MITNTDAYLRLKEQAQENIDFALLVCHAVPALNAYMKAVDKKAAPALPKPDYFRPPQTHARLRALKASYRKLLGRTLLLSSFSCFEYYIKNSIQEILNFHGGKDHLVELLKGRNLASIKSTNAELEKLRAIINKPRRARDRQRQIQAQTRLNELGFRFPSDLLAGYGARQFSIALSDLRAADIPAFLEEGLLFQMTDVQKETFGKLRTLRNGIAHGDKVVVELSDAVAANSFFRDLAKLVDAHLVRNFLVIEDHA